MFKRSCSQKFFKMLFLKFLLISQENACVEVSLNKVAACNFIEKRLQHRCFPVKSVKFLRTSFSENTSNGCILCLQTTKYVSLAFSNIFLGRKSNDPDHLHYVPTITTAKSISPQLSPHKKKKFNAVYRMSRRLKRTHERNQ